ncbi:hypothetical protein HDU83_003437 [Entophlyctis luteolus]|nr:hypothetical protein HDU83_003437 [Entophlyctis luteolus]
MSHSNILTFHEYLRKMQTNATASSRSCSSVSESDRSRSNIASRETQIGLPLKTTLTSSSSASSNTFNTRNEGGKNSEWSVSDISPGELLRMSACSGVVVSSKQNEEENSSEGVLRVLTNSVGSMLTHGVSRLMSRDSALGPLFPQAQTDKFSKKSRIAGPRRPRLDGDIENLDQKEAGAALKIAMGPFCSVEKRQQHLHLKVTESKDYSEDVLSTNTTTSTNTGGNRAAIPPSRSLGSLNFSESTIDSGSLSVPWSFTHPLNPKKTAKTVWDQYYDLYDLGYSVQVIMDGENTLFTVQPDTEELQAPIIVRTSEIEPRASKLVGNHSSDALNSDSVGFNNVQVSSGNAKQSSFSTSIHRSAKFQLSIGLCVIHVVQASLSYSITPTQTDLSSLAPINPSATSESQAPDTRYESIQTVGACALAVAAVGLALLQCMTTRSRTGGVSAKFALTWAVVGATGFFASLVISVLVAVGNHDGTDLRGRLCGLGAGGNGDASECLKAWVAIGFGLLASIMWICGFVAAIMALVKNTSSPTGIEVSEAKLRDETHFTLQEIKKLRAEFQRQANPDFTISKDQFKATLRNHVQCWSVGAQYLFLERLFDVFDVDGSKTIDFREFIQGLSTFMKGTAEEKMEPVSFKLYDIDHSGSIEPKELINIMGRMYSAFYNEDQTGRVRQVVTQIFADLDINGDGSLSMAEYKLMALKEPLIVDFLEQFLIVAPESECE